MSALPVDASALRGFRATAIELAHAAGAVLLQHQEIGRAHV